MNKRMIVFGSNIGLCCRHRSNQFLFAADLFAASAKSLDRENQTYILLSIENASNLRALQYVYIGLKALVMASGRQNHPEKCQRYSELQRKIV